MESFYSLCEKDLKKETFDFFSICHCCFEKVKESLRSEGWDDTFHETGSMQKHLINAAKFIDEEINKNNCVFVHCWAGISRSSTMIIAYLIKYKQFIFRDALQYVRDKRSKIYPNASFVSELKLFEQNKGLLPNGMETTDQTEGTDDGCMCLIL